MVWRSNRTKFDVEGESIFGERGVFGGGQAPGYPPETDTIDYITISTPGNATDFGNLTQSRKDLAGASNRSRGVFGED